MAATNHERIGKALEVFNGGLTPFIERELQRVFGDKWKATVQQMLGSGKPPRSGKSGPHEWDTASLLKVMWECWNEVFATTLGRAERSLVSELIEVRNKWALMRTKILCGLVDGRARFFRVFKSDKSA